MASDPDPRGWVLLDLLIACALTVGVVFPLLNEIRSQLRRQAQEVARLHVRAELDRLRRRLWIEVHSAGDTARLDEVELKVPRGERRVVSWPGVAEGTLRLVWTVTDELDWIVLTAEMPNVRERVWIPRPPDE